MNFLLLQDTVVAAISANAYFAPNAATTVTADDGASKRFLEAALQNSGFFVSVWPPTHGQANQGEDAHVGAECVVIVRLGINPVKMKAVKTAYDADHSKPTPGNYITLTLSKVIESVLNIAPSPTGVRFALAPDAFELVNFDEGLVAYHVRFMRLAVFGVV